MNMNTKEVGVSKLLLQYYEHSDEVALSDFFKLVQNLVFRIAYSVVHNQADADDLMQQTFIKIIQKDSICQAAYELDDAKVKSWVLSIVYNFSRMFLRSKKIKSTYQLDERFDMPTTEDKLTPSLQSSENSEINQKLKTAIFSLSEKYRVPLLLRYLEDMSIEDISKSLSANPSTIRSSLKRGLEQLRNKLSSDNMMLSSTAAIDLLANVSLPTSKKTITPSFIKSYSMMKSTSNKLATYSSTKSNIILKIIITLVIFGATTTYFIYSPITPSKPNVEKTLAVTLNKPEAPKSLPLKTKWDFSKEDGTDIKLIKNQIIHNEELKAITNNNVDGQKGTIICLDIKPKNYSKIITTNLLIESDFTKDNPIRDFLIDFAPILYDKPVSGLCIYRIKTPINLKSSKLIPHYQEIYVMDNLYIHHTKNNGITKIFKFDEFEPDVKIGLLIENIYVQKISIEPMNDESIIDMKKIVKEVLSNSSKKKP